MSNKSEPETETDSSDDYYGTMLYQLQQESNPDPDELLAELAIDNDWSSSR